MTQRHGVSKHYWENGANRLTQLRGVTNLQLVNNPTSLKNDKAKCDGTSHVYIQGLPVITSFTEAKDRSATDFSSLALLTFGVRSLLVGGCPEPWKMLAVP